MSIPGALCITDGPCLAQALATPKAARLTIRPREMATAAHTERAGKFSLDSFRPGDSVYVPARCVGTQRCPLIVAMEGQAMLPRVVVDKYGMILLTVYTRTGDEIVTPANIAALDAALKYVLQHFAIDPEKIAIVGNCHSGSPAQFVGGLNLDVFSRIIAFSGSTAPPAGMDSLNTTTELLIGSGYLESEGDFATVQAWRQAGHPVKHLLSVKLHGNNVDEYDFMGHWLQQSWAAPVVSSRPAPPIVADPLPALTTQALAQLTTFWTRFMQQPDSIRTTARRRYLREVRVPVGPERPSVWMVDMAALAAKYPAVAADLRFAGLTARQHEAYRAALLSASVTRLVNNVAERAAADSAFARTYRNGGLQPGDSEWMSSLGMGSGPPPLPHPVPARLPLDAMSVPARNVAFLDAHPDELAALETTGIWRTP